MRDDQIERIALISIIAGLLLILIIMPKYEAVDAHYLTENDNNAYLKGTITRKNYNEDSKWSFIEIRSCRDMNSFYEGEINKTQGDEIKVKGSYYEGTFTIEEYK